DNRKLDGFIDRFLLKSCIDVDCDKCKYCHTFAARAVTIDPAYRKDVLEQYRSLFSDMNDGSFWSMSRRDLIEVKDLVRRAASKVVPSLVPQEPPPVTCPASDD